jgi:hypothetical protein
MGALSLGGLNLEPRGPIFSKGEGMAKKGGRFGEKFPNNSQTRIGSLNGKNDRLRKTLLSYGVRFSFADVAQLVEQLPCKQQVIGSSPIVSFLSL